MKPLINLLLTLSIVVLLISCDSNLKPETQGKKMATFFQNNNNASLPNLAHQRGRALLATKQALSLSTGFVKEQATKLATKQASSLSTGFIKDQATKLATTQTLNASPVRTQAREQRLNADFIRTQATELENRFPRLPNPVLNMFIVPHLSKDGHPVPGYTTHFKLYKLDQYALPGESL